MKQTEFDRLASLAGLTENETDKAEFIRSLQPLFDMMDSVRSFSPEDIGENEEPESVSAPERVMTLREDSENSRTDGDRLLSLSMRRTGTYYHVPRSI